MPARPTSPVVSGAILAEGCTMSELAETCREGAGDLAPVIDLARCESKADCRRVCPFDVFEVRVATSAERRSLGLLSQLRSMAHGHKKAFAVRADQCHACGLCVEACPETAIRLLKPRPA
jgi:NAD-dependent dihydropyrimidine dehydrogenase PreA subunit